jgi:predicted metal-dependent hydrolase
MFTTNTSSRASAVTYVQRRKETERLLEIEQRMEDLALSLPHFSDDPAFERLATQHKDQLQRILSLSL